MQETIQENIDQIIAVITLYGLDVLAALVILFIGFKAASIIQNWIKAIMSRSGKVDETVIGFLASLAKYAIVAFTIIAVLERFGFETASLIAVLGAMGLAVGLALQGTLSHVASGVMLLLFRPFKVGQFIEVAGHAGTIKLISLFTTELDTGDNVRIIIPNGSVWGSAIKNFSFNDTRRVDMVYGIGYGDDIGKAMDVIRACIAADDRIHGDPEPLVVVGNLGADSVDLTVRVWCASGDYWGIKFDITKAIKEAFDKEGIDIPYAQRVVHMKEG